MASDKVQHSGLDRLWHVALTHRVLIVFSCILALGSVVASFMPFIAVYYIIRELVTTAGGSGPDMGVLVRLGWTAAGMAALAVLLNFLALMFSHVAAFKTLYKVKYDFMVHLASLPLGFHTQHSTGKLRKIVDENIEKLESFIAHQLPDIAGSFAAPLTVFVILMLFDWRLGLAALVPVTGSYVVLHKGYGAQGSDLMLKEYQDRLEDMNNASVEYVRGISVIKAFNQTLYSFRQFYQSIRSYTIYCLKFTRCYENYMTLFLVLLNSVYLFLVPVAMFLYSDSLNYAEFALSVIFYLIFSMSIATPFLKLMYVSGGLKQVVGGLERMDAILAVQALPEPENPQTVNGYDVEFDNVTFSYAPGEEDSPDVLKQVTMMAREGETTALVGPSGSGKSTMASLIPRFFDVTGGAVRIGGVDIRNMKSEYLLSKVSFVFQDIFLFKQSIMDNILTGRPEATREEAIEASKAAQCHDFIVALPHGYDTVIGTRGIHLSGGERQRVVIARALLKNAPVLVLDEATAFADPENEHRIQQALAVLMQGKTVIMIAHRLATIRNADHIVVLDEGRVVQQGKHDALLAEGGCYATMWDFYTRTLTWKMKREPSGDGSIAGAIPGENASYA